MRNLKTLCWRVGGIFLVVLSVSGCPKKTPPPSESTLGPTGGGPELGEHALPPPSDQGKRVEDRLAGGGESGPLQDIHFNYDSFELSSEARDILRSNANWLQSNMQVKVEIEGHCDDRGTVEYNLALGAKRAKAARDYLVSLGISPERMSTISYGEELPLCHDSNESCWQQNRRVHFLVLNR